MRRKLVLLFVVAQVLVLAFMAGKREFIVHAGERIHLRTAPVDPRDLFRGDFVRLNYEVSSVGPKLMRDGVSEHLGEKATRSMLCSPGERRVSSGWIILPTGNRSPVSSCVAGLPATGVFAAIPPRRP